MPPGSYLTLLEPRSLDSCSCRRHINFANASHDELEHLAQACEPASFGKGNETVFDEAYRKARKMDSELFSPTLDPSQTDLIKLIRANLLEGTQGDSAKKTMKMELYKLNIYGTHGILFASI